MEEHVEVWPSGDGWRWRRWSRNKTDELYESGEAFASKSNAVRSAEDNNPGVPIEITEEGVRPTP